MRLTHSRVTSTKAFPYHLYSYLAKGKDGSKWAGLARVPAGWVGHQVRRAIKAATPNADTLELKWEPSLEGKVSRFDHDFVSNP